MKLSTRTRYGIRAMLELAENQKSKRPLQTKVIAQRQDMSVKYLEQLMSVLKMGGFVRSVRGSKGGYVLAKRPNQIKLSDVFNCLEGQSRLSIECIENEDYCARTADCAARQIWAEVEKAIETVLQSTTLQDLVDRMKGDGTLDYQI